MIIRNHFNVNVALTFEAVTDIVDFNDDSSCFINIFDIFVSHNYAPQMISAVKRM